MDIVIVMGSLSDLSKVEKTIKVLDNFDVEIDVQCLSAHRNAKALDAYMERVNQSDAKVIIALAGMSAALPGVIASKTIKPVLGVPLTCNVLDGVDALYSMVQMPSGIPVGTLGIDGMKNAAYLALEIVALQKETVRKQLMEYRLDLEKSAIKANEELQTQLGECHE